MDSGYQNEHEIHEKEQCAPPRKAFYEQPYYETHSSQSRMWAARYVHCQLPPQLTQFKIVTRNTSWDVYVILASR
jgi:hypothetical protein